MFSDLLAAADKENTKINNNQKWPLDAQQVQKLLQKIHTKQQKT